MRLAAGRFLKDLKRARRKCKPPFVFNEWHANDVCGFVEKLPHVEGRWGKSTIELAPAQIFFLVQLFGFRRANGLRRFTMALFAVARKNAKSTLAAGILLYCLCCEDEPGPQVICAATTGGQARIVFDIARRMVERLPALQAAFDVDAFRNSIARYEVGGSLKPINAKASTQDGLNPSAVNLDELHAHKTRDLYDVLRSAAGARDNPLFLYTTTEGYENAGPWSEVRHFCHQVLEGLFEADHFLGLYFSLDEKDEDYDEAKWAKANPLMGVSVSIEKLREYATEAKRQPGAQAEFRIKRLNRQSSTSSGWIDLRKWRRCKGPVDLDELERLQAPCWGALDLASNRDLVAWRLLWLLDGQLYTWGRRWVPADAVTQRTERGLTAYSKWVAAGLLTETPGDVTDFSIVEQAVFEDWERFQPQTVGFDPWNAEASSIRLMDQGVQMVKFIQGPKSYHPAMKALERAYCSRLLNHGGDEVLAWCASNLVPRYDGNMNMAPDRKRSADKIDDMAALIMAFGLYEAAVDAGDFDHFLRDPIIA